MRYCSRCNMNIRSRDGETKCPLCGALTFDTHPHGEEDDYGDVYPSVPTIFERYNFIIRVAVFAAFALSAIVIGVNLMVPRDGLWSLFVVAGIFCALLAFIAALRRRNNIQRNILSMAALVSAFSVLWDIITSWRGWSLDFVVPSLLALSLVLIFVVALVFRIRIERYIHYLFVNCALALLPALFLALRLVGVIYPSYICVIFAVIVLAGLLILYTNKIIPEIKRRFHM